MHLTDKYFKRGESWGTINAEWERLTGNKPGKSTLPNRFPRLKANLACVAANDVAQMLKSEAEVNEQIEAEVKELWGKKWVRVGKHMEDAGTQNYPVSYSAGFLNTPK